MRITVLGGAGKMGCIAVQCLAADPRVDQVVIADLNEENAGKVVDTVKSSKVSIRPIDLNDKKALVALLKESDVCLNATTYYTNLDVMDACVEAGVHYTDMGGLFHITRKQVDQNDRFAEAGVSAVLCMGSAPGVPNVQARYAADRLDTIDSIRIYDGIKPPPPDDLRFTYAVPTILDEIRMAPMAFENGEFVAKEPLTGFEDYWFTPPIGLLPMHYSLHSEVATLPVSFKDKGIRECIFKIDYWGMSKETIEKVRMLAQMGFDSEETIDLNGQKVSPREVMASVLSQHVPDVTDYMAPAKTSPPDWTKEIVTEVRGTKDGEHLLYRLGTLMCKGAMPTGLGPAIAAIWLAEGRFEPGVHVPERVIDPEAFFKELEAYEIETHVSVSRKL